MNLRADGCAIDKELSAAFSEKILRPEKNLPHGRIVGHDGKNDVGKPTHIRYFIYRLAAQFLGKLRCILCVCVEECCDLISELVQTPSHVRAHTTHPDKTDSGGFHKDKIIIFGLKGRDGLYPGRKNELYSMLVSLSSGSCRCCRCRCCRLGGTRTGTCPDGLDLD